MKKSLSVLVVLSVVAALSTAVVAQDSVLWFDIRDDSGGFQSIGTPVAPYTNGQRDPALANPGPALNFGGAGDAQILRVNPDCINDFELDSVGNGGVTRYPNYDGDNDLKTGTLWLYMDVFANVPVGTNEVISSIGIDINTTQVGTGIGQLASIAYTWTGTGFSDSNAGFAHGASDAANPPSWLDAKAVKVPVITGPLYAVGTGLTPGGPYLIGRLDVIAGDRGQTGAGHHSNSIYELRLSVNSLLITRVFETGGDTQEDVSFGYAGGLPETPAVNGSVMGGTSATPDAEIHVRTKGDSNGDGAVTSGDIQVGQNAFKRLVGIVIPGDEFQEQVYLHDFNNTHTATSGDITGFKNAINAAGPTGATGQCN